jgi:hypothetical protein
VFVHYFTSRHAYLYSYNNYLIDNR